MWKAEKFPPQHDGGNKRSVNPGELANSAGQKVRRLLSYPQGKEPFELLGRKCQGEILHQTCDLQTQGFNSAYDFVCEHPLPDICVKKNPALASGAVKPRS